MTMDDPVVDDAIDQYGLDESVRPAVTPELIFEKMGSLEP